MNLSQVSALTEEQARAYVENIRWPEGPVCPHCGSKEHVRLQGKSTRPGVIKCKNPACRLQYTVTVGTVMERSHIKLRHWAMAFHLICSSKKGISAYQMHRELGITPKSAWFLCHRIRHAMNQGAFAGKLQGTVEVDETYVGGRERGVIGRQTKKKTPVVALVERGGAVRAMPVKRVTAKNLRSQIVKNVDKSATLMTDEFRSYIKVGREFGGHKVVKHKDGNYVTYEDDVVVTTNTVESFFALLKRGHYGVFHQLSRQHLHRYCDEFSFRWTHRQINDGARRDLAMKGAEGKRLTYR